VAKNELEVRRGTIRWPNTVNSNLAYRGVEQAAWQEARAAVGPSEQVVSLEVHGGVAEKGNDGVMVWKFSYHGAEARRSTAMEILRELAATPWIRPLNEDVRCKQSLARATGRLGVRGRPSL
jgi:hypothetical protein